MSIRSIGIGSALAILQVSTALAADSGRELFVQRCSVCHGADASGTDRAPALAGNRRLRTRPASQIAGIIRDGTPGGMPAFPLPEDQLAPLAEYTRSLNATAFEAPSAGDAAAGERFFFSAGNCASCHTVGGTGGSNGPDLSNIARQLTPAELEQSLKDPSARIASGVMRDRERPPEPLPAMRRSAPIAGWRCWATAYSSIPTMPT